MLPATEGVGAGYSEIETLAPEVALRVMLESQVAAVGAVGPALPALAAAAVAVAERLRDGGRLAYAGAGTSGRIAIQDGAELPPTFGFPRERLVMLMAGGEAALVRAVEGAEDDGSGADAAGLGPGDVLVGVAASGATPYTAGCLRVARAAGALTVGVANSAGALLEAAAYPVLLATGAEVIAGSTRLGAGTAQKVALNLFSTLVMMRLGRVYRGQMVEMLGTNDKLRRRAVRMVAGLAGVGPEAAGVALDAAGGRVKVALLVLRGFSVVAAEAALAAAGGDMRVVDGG
jgi:N-acetylmuramic acid 6-phosphate etherase